MYVIKQLQNDFYWKGGENPNTWVSSPETATPLESKTRATHIARSLGFLGLVQIIKLRGEQ